MSKLAVALAGALPLAAATAAGAQTLSQRIDAVMQTQRAPRAHRESAGRILTVLREPLTVRFDRTPARAALEHLRTALGVEIIVRYADDPSGSGIDPQTPVTLALESRRALDVLELLLEECSVLEPCTWQIRKGLLEIGTKARLAAPEAQEVRVYPITDLVYEAPSFSNAPSLRLDYVLPYYGGPFGPWPSGAPFSFGPYGLGYGGTIQPAPVRSGEPRRQGPEALLELIVKTIEPGAWERDGGTWASIEATGEVLVVRAPDFIHRQIGGYPGVAARQEVATRGASEGAPSR
jgi:hypothetical protein